MLTVNKLHGLCVHESQLTICIYIYTHTYIMHVYTYTHLHTYMCVCIYIHTLMHQLAPCKNGINTNYSPVYKLCLQVLLTYSGLPSE